MFEQISIVCGLLLRQIQVTRRIRLYSKMDKILDFARRWIFGVFLVVTSLNLDIRPLLAFLGVGRDLIAVLGWFLLGLGGDALFGYLHNKMYPYERPRLPVKGKEGKEEKEEDQEENDHE